MEIGKLLKDQPMTGLEKAVWWTEYVIRNKGALYLSNPRADVSWSEFLILDVAAFLLCTLFIILFVFFKTSRYIVRLIFKTRKLKQKLQ